MAKAVLGSIQRRTAEYGKYWIEDSNIVVLQFIIYQAKDAGVGADAKNYAIFNSIPLVMH